MINSITSVGFQVIAADLQLSLSLARRFKTVHGAKVHIYVRAPEEKSGIERMETEGLIDSIEVSQKVTPALRQVVFDEDSVIKKAATWEARIGETFNRLAFEHRHLSRGYFAGGGWVPRSPLVERASYVQMLNGFNQALDFWENEIKTKKFSLLVGADKSAIAVCRLFDVPYRRLFSSKFGDENFWALDEKANNPEIQAIYNNLTVWPEFKLADTYTGHKNKLVRSLSSTRIPSIVKGIGRSLTKGLLLQLFGSYGGQIGFADSIAVNFRARVNYRRYQRLARNNLMSLAGERFIYFPLHKEPETNMLAASPEYFNQVSAIMSLSRDLPAGVRLAVKEHIPSFALRQPGFYEQLADLKPVVLLDVFVPSAELINRAAATVTINGAAGLEAAAVGKPVIQFGRHMANSFLPHVMTVTDDDQLRSYLHDVLNGSVNLQQAKQDGARFREALRRASFEMSDFMVDFSKNSEESTESAFRALLASFELGSEDAVA